MSVRIYLLTTIVRGRFRRRLGMTFDEIFFKPSGIPLRQLKTITITDEELEVLRLRYIEKLGQEEASKKMGISQSQYQRDLTFALEKITEALISGNAINIKRVIT